MPPLYYFSHKTIVIQIEARLTLLLTAIVVELAASTLVDFDTDTFKPLFFIFSQALANSFERHLSSQ